MSDVQFFGKTSIIIIWGFNKSAPVDSLYEYIHKTNHEAFKQCYIDLIIFCMSTYWLFHYTPAPSKVEWRYTGFTQRLSVHPLVCRQGFWNFLKKLLAHFISYLAFNLLGWVSWLLFIFVFLASFLALWWSNIRPKMGFSELSEKTIGPINFISGIYPYGISLLTPIYFFVPSVIFGPLVAKYLAENGVSGTFWKKNYWFDSFHTWHLPL